jgi:hypothetical protein
VSETTSRRWLGSTIGSPYSPRVRAHETYEDGATAEISITVQSEGGVDPDSYELYNGDFIEIDLETD